MNLKLGMVVTRINRIVQKSFVAIATCLEEISFSASITYHKGSIVLSSCNTIGIAYHLAKEHRIIALAPWRYGQARCQSSKLLYLFIQLKVR